MGWMEGIIPPLHLLGHSLSVSPSYFPSDAPHPWIPNLIAQDSRPQLCDIWAEIILPHGACPVPCVTFSLSCTPTR